MKNWGNDKSRVYKIAALGALAGILAVEVLDWITAALLGAR